MADGGCNGVDMKKLVRILSLLIATAAVALLAPQPTAERRAIRQIAYVPVTSGSGERQASRQTVSGGQMSTPRSFLNKC
jgi:hypothetical protein